MKSKITISMLVIMKTMEKNMFHDMHAMATAE